MAPAAILQQQALTDHIHNGSACTHELKLKNEVPLDKDVVLTTFTNGAGINPLPLNWGASDPQVRGPIVASRIKQGLSKHNAIGAHSGSYCIYHALAVGSKQLNPNYDADYTNAQPAFKIPTQAQWSDGEKIVSMDPFGHLTPWLFNEVGELEDVEIRPTISVTKAHMQLFEMKDAVEKGRLQVDGDVVINSNGDLNVSKVAVEPVWYLPGVAKRFGITENELRKALFEDTNGMYPELITRPDIKVFLPPIDVFGSDICTCRPYLIFGIEEAVKEAQNGGSGVVVYFRKEGRALGEVTKYLVYNARKRGGDTAAEYFHRTECIAGVRDMRFQQLMPDVLHWLGITKIDRMLSMSNMKHDAIVDQGIPIIERIPIPDELIPPDSRVEIDAKINSGYFTNGKILNTEELKDVKGRGWNDIE
ncbi:unnamed protein product [Wickerhamomyces anomalus]